MSHRAIQRLRQERESDLPPEEESDEEHEDDGNAAGGKTGFAFMMGDDDSDDSSSEEDSESQDDVDEQAGESTKDSRLKNEMAPTAAREPGEKCAGEADNLDAILEEFKIQDVETDEIQTPEEDKASFFDIITSRMEGRDLDIDYVMRTSLLGSNEDSATRSGRRGRQASVFGPPRDNWPRPPRHVGGGLGMASYDTEPQLLLWPYSDMKEGDDRCPGPDRWFKFMYSDSYKRDCEDYERIKASGDPNSLALFIAHHPFVVEALLQLSTVLYQTNQSQEGLSLLKRALFVYECASLNSFLRIEGRVGFMDYDQKENELFFLTLSRLARVSHVAGLPRASLAVSRFLLSLDPLRDPMGILLALDHFALLSNTDNKDRWIVEFIDNDKVSVFYKDDTSSEGYQCGLLDLPNWAYSYALALYRINQNDPSPELEAKANNAIKTALSRFPSVLEELLHKNEVNVTGRSFQIDWPSVLGYARDLSGKVLNKLSDAAAADPVVRACTQQAYELIVRIFVQQNFKLWSADHLLQWMYRNLKDLKDMEDDDGLIPLSPALMRYARSDPSNYEDKFQTMPAEANPLDPGLVAHALTVDTNRPRFIQRMQRGEGMAADGLDFAANQQGAMLAGPPTEIIDPDWPLLEVFWRSALPWAHVEGVPPPQR